MQPSSTPGSKSPPRVDDVTEVGSTRWLGLQTLTYTDEEGTQRKWDMAARKSKQPADLTIPKFKRVADAVIIIPLLRSKKKGTVETLLVEQFRPPVGQMTMEFPAGLIDENENPGQAALRELVEETGYKGKVEKISPMVCMTPGLTDESVHIVVVEVDLDNHGPVETRLEEGEIITQTRVNFPDGLNTILAQKKSSMPLMGLQMFIMGLDMGMNM